MCEIYLEIINEDTRATSSAFNVNLEQISHIVSGFAWLSFNQKCRLGRLN